MGGHQNSSPGVRMTVSGVKVYNAVFIIIAEEDTRTL